MKQRGKKILSVLIAALTAAGLFAPLPAAASPLPGEYDAGDVAVLNGILDGNGLDGYNRDDPAGWDFAVWTDSPSGKRVSGLSLGGKSLTGELTVTGLTGLEELDCSGNHLTGLDVRGLDLGTVLVRLDIGYNDMPGVPYWAGVLCDPEDRAFLPDGGSGDSFFVPGPQKIAPAPVTFDSPASAGAVPKAETADAGCFTAELSWGEDAPASFGYNETYTATVTLTAVDGYTFDGEYTGYLDTASIAGFTVNGAAPVEFIGNASDAGGSALTFKAAFETGAEPPPPAAPEPAPPPPAAQEPAPAAPALFAAAAPSGPYTATVRYYDDVQLTYTLHYPSGGIWSGGADVPVGGMGTVSDQIYCVDPFVPFHSTAQSSWQPGGTHDGVWMPGATVDTKGDYTAAAPWAVSPAMRVNGGAVRWLVLNGYRGNYLADDGVSRDSVARLQSRSGIGAVNKKIALMATKFAIWKVLAGEHIELIGTSLNASERAAFDLLVQFLYDSATAGAPPDWNLKATEVRLTVNDGGVVANAPDGTYEFYGPLTVSAELENPAPDPLAAPGVSQVFLSVTGQDLDGVAFITDMSQPETSELPADGEIPGTANSAQYIAGGPFAGNGWTSPEFFIRVPVQRGQDSGDHVERWSSLMTVKAMAAVTDVPLLAGTPVTFVSGANGAQDWNAVQAFIGAANENMRMNLYAEDAIQTNDTAAGQIWVEKRVENATPLDNERTFTFQVSYSSTGAAGSFSPVNLNEYPVHGAASSGTDTFTLKNGGLAFLDGLPAEWFYRVTETDPSGDYSVSYEISLSEDPPSAGGTPETASFRMDDPTGGGAAMVTFINTRTARNNQPKKAMAHFYLTKIAARYRPDAENPDIVTNLPFTFLIESSEDGGGTWRPVDLTGRFSAGGGGRVIDAPGGTLEILSNHGVFIELDADANQIYRVTEVLDTDDPNREFTPIYSLFGHWYNASASVWEPEFLATSSTDPEWNAGSGPYAAKLSGAQPDGVYNLQFVNFNTTFHDMRLSKTVDGDVRAGDRERLFRFQILYTEHTGMFDPGPIPLSYDHPETGMLITGIPAGRIQTDGNGAPTILELRHGETAVIESLPAGSYKVAELNGAEYSAAYTVNAGGEKSADGGETEAVSVRGDTQIAFRNTVRTSSGSSGSGIPNTGDGDGVTGWLIALLTSAPACLLLARRKRRRPDWNG